MSYSHQEYPKCIYKNGESKIVQDEDEYKACDGWSESPAKKKAKPGPKPKAKAE